MQTATSLSQDRIQYLRLLAEKYPTKESLYNEIINLNAILHLPKGTEHFISDVHGEYESFYHILNNCSGVIREKLHALYGENLSHKQRSQLCTLIYYPEEKLKRLREQGVINSQWYEKTLLQLIDLAKLLSDKYSRSKVRKVMPQEYAYILDELMHAQPNEDSSQQRYHKRILETLIEIGSADSFICALAQLIKRLAVDRLHMVGDIFDRGPRPDSIIDLLMQHHAVDIQWGNHDILWMGAAAGNECCMAAVVRNSIAYGNMMVLESGYGISLRPLTVFGEKFYPKLTPEAAAVQAITVIMFKLEGQLIHRHPEYDMDDHLLLSHLNFENQTIEIQDHIYTLKSFNFPTVNPEHPYELIDEEKQVIDELREAFAESARLHRHIQFLYQHGSIYRRCNGNLLFHGCIPMNEDGSFHVMNLSGIPVQGRTLMDLADKMARDAYYSHNPSSADFLWYLWCGEYSPLCGRKVKTFAHLYVDDPEADHEPRNAYYRYYELEETALRILREFGLAESGHIVNGHTPILVSKGERPVKGGGRVLVIDGGFCRAMQRKTGLAGYTLIANSHGLRLMSHQPFTTLEAALDENSDIHSESETVDVYARRQTEADTDNGLLIVQEIEDLTALLEAYRTGLISPDHHHL